MWKLFPCYAVVLSSVHLAAFAVHIVILLLIFYHYIDVIMGTIASQVTSLTIDYSTVYSGADQRKHKSSASLAFVWGIHRRPVNSPHKWPVTRKMFPFDDVIMYQTAQLICFISYLYDVYCISLHMYLMHIMYICCIYV